MDGDKPRIIKVLEAAYAGALEGSEIAQKTLIERRFGRPSPSDEESALAVAEHMRKVESDRIDVALKVLGERIYSMPREELVRWFAECARDPRGFLRAAEEHLGVQRAESEAEPPGPPAALAECATDHDGEGAK